MSAGDKVVAVCTARGPVSDGRPGCARNAWHTGCHKSADNAAGVALFWEGHYPEPPEDREKAWRRRAEIAALYHRMIVAMFADGQALTADTAAKMAKASVLCTECLDTALEAE